MLTYNSDKNRYSAYLGEHPQDGSPVYLVVEGAEMAEAVEDGGSLEELCEDVALWKGLVGDNQNVYYANTPYGEDEHV